MESTALSHRVIGWASEVHRTLSPGLLESAEEQCLAHELKLQGLSFLLQPPLAVRYKGLHLEGGSRVDILVENQSILELENVDQLSGIHAAQLLTSRKMAGLRHGFLLNFNIERLKEGLQSFVLS